MRNKDGKITFKSFWKWLRSNQGKKYSFFIFYIFFFIFIFILLSFDNIVENNKENDNNQEQQESLPFSLTSLQQDKYKFNYTIKSNDNLYLYIGSKEGDTFTLTDNQEIVYIYTYQNGSLKPSVETDGDIFYQLLDVYQLKRIIKRSQFISKTEYNNGNISYIYEINNSEFADILTLEIIKNEDLGSLVLKNEITVVINNEGILSITFDILNLINSTDLDNSYDNYQIVLNYGVENE